MKILATAVLLLLCSTSAAFDKGDSAAEKQATEFFHHYIDLYNQRFGHPEKSQWFQNEMSKLIHEPMLSAPLNSRPAVPESSAGYAGNLEAFVMLLENQGVSRLEYTQIQLHVMTPNKILANNVGRGLNNSGEVLYETISVYFLYRNNNEWQIAMLNAYDVKNALSL